MLEGVTVTDFVSCIEEMSIEKMRGRKWGMGGLCEFT
jgi:hypothetical protein